jgi:signal recognition particle receptor subunit beta
VKLETLRSVSKAVVFVVDGTSPQTISKVAQFLYTLLVDPVFTARRTPFFIAINKTDQLDLGAAQSQDDANDSEEEETTTGNSQVDKFAARLEKILSVGVARETPESLSCPLADVVRFSCFSLLQ